MLNNRFKFRIWDKPTNKMFYDVCIGFIKDGCPPPYDWVCADTPDGQISYTGDRLKDIEIMQYTGLKDKNGELIFEGDIVKIFNTKDDFEQIRSVVFKDCAFQFNLPNSMQIDKPLYCWAINYLNHYKHIEIEVIGNIYENPELLEEEL